MRRLRGLGLAIGILAGLSGCTGLQHHLSWPSNEVNETGEQDSRHFAFWRKPSAERATNADADTNVAETFKAGSSIGEPASAPDIWSERHSEGLARFFPNTVRRWNRLTGRSNDDSSDHVAQVPAQPGNADRAERTALNDGSQDRQVRTVRMDRDAEIRGDDSEVRAGSPAGSPPTAARVEKRNSPAAHSRDDSQSGVRDGDADKVGFVAIEPTSAGRPQQSYAELARDPVPPARPEVPESLAASEATLISGGSAASASVGLLAMNTNAAASPAPGTGNTSSPANASVPDTATATPAADLVPATNAPNGLATGRFKPAPGVQVAAADLGSNSAGPKDPGPTADGPATSALRKRLLSGTGSSSSVSDTPVSQPAAAPKLAAAAANGELTPRLASAAGSAVQSPPLPAAELPQTSASAPAQAPAIAPAQATEVTAPTAAAGSGHKHRFLGWLCPLEQSNHPVLPSSQLPPVAYPTSYKSCSPSAQTKTKHAHASSQSDGCVESPAPKKPCFLKTWLHTPSQDFFEVPLVTPQSEVVNQPPAPKKPCFLNRWLHHPATETAFASPQTSPQSSVVETVAVKKPCFLKNWFHKFDHGSAGCECAGCLDGGSHCCCESKRSCGFGHHSVVPSGQLTAPSPASPAAQAAAAQTDAKDNVVRASSGGPVADDVAEEGQLRSAASADRLDKASQG
jgi:hypothetical protein